PAISSERSGHETRSHAVRADHAAAGSPARVEASAILLRSWWNSSSAHRGLALVGLTTKKPCGEARRFEVETKPILSRLAHHRRHRLWQDEVRHQSTRSPSLSKRADMGRPVH